VDPNNPVVRHCVAGMQAEAQGRFAEAHDYFCQAWDKQTDDLEACIAAHYLARHQETPQETLRWNEEALSRALAVGDERVRSFYPSLYLNLGWSHEQLGEQEAAQRHYTLAAAHAAALPADAYGTMVREGVAAGLQRLDQDSSAL
jgi:hypothetical protein